MSAEPAELIPTPDQLRLDAERPWPRLVAFREADAAFFHGRDSDIGNLYRMVMRERLTVLFGMSGLGKTSLLQAGLFPKLRDENLLPIRIRLDYADQSPPLLQQIKQAIVVFAGAANVESPPVREAETLWEYFHRKGADFWNARNRVMTPVLVFDQFEEVFTLGRDNPARAAEIKEIIGELADLIERYCPETVKSRLDQYPEEAQQYAFNHHPYKLVFSLREDFLADFESRDQRRLREQQERTEHAWREAEEREERVRQDLRRSQRRFLFSLILTGIAIGAAFWAIISYHAAEDAKWEAQKALAAAEFREAYQHYQANNFDKTLAFLARAVRMSPDFSPARSLLFNLLNQTSWSLPVGVFIHHDSVRSAEFSPDGQQQVVTASDDTTARLWDVLTGTSGDITLLADLAEAVGSNEVNELGAVVRADDPVSHLQRLRKQTADAPPGEPGVESFIRWFLADRYTRTISPLSQVTVPEYLQRLIAEGRRDEAKRDFPGHPSLCEKPEASDPPQTSQKQTSPIGSD